MNGSPRATQALNGSRMAMPPHTAWADNVSHVSVHMPPGKPTAFVLHTAFEAQSLRGALATRSRFASSGPASHGSPAARGSLGRHWPTPSPAGASYG